MTLADSAQHRLTALQYLTPHALIPQARGPGGLLFDTGNTYTDDVATFHIVGDLTIDTYVQLDVYSGINQDLIGRWSGAANWSYTTLILISGAMRLYWSTGGSVATLMSADSTVPIPFAGGQPVWLRFSLDVNNGGVWTVTFYTSTDSVTWTQLGAVVSGGTTTSVFAGTSPMIIGGAPASGYAKGIIKRAKVHSGLPGSLVNVYDADFTAQGWTTGETTGATHNEANGLAVILNASIKVVGELVKDDRYNAAGHLLYVPVPITPRATRPWRGQRSEEYFIELINFKGKHVANLAPAIGGRIDGVTDAPIARKLSGLILNPGDWETVDIDQVRLKPWMVIDGVAEPLGVFTRVTRVKRRTWRGTYLELQCQDLSFRLQSTFSRSANVVPGDNLGTKVTQFMNEINVYDRVLTATNVSCTAFLGAPIGKPRINFIGDLCKLGGVTPPWYDRFGVAHTVPIPYAGYTRRLRSYNPGENCWIVEGSGSETDELWNIPTGWLVIGRSDKGVQYAGRYDLPSTHPMSSAARDGFENVKVIELAGIESNDAAKARAQDQAQLDTRVNATAEFDALPDPTIEPWSILQYIGTDMLLDSWSHTLTPGEKQHIKVRESIIV